MWTKCLELDDWAWRVFSLSILFSLFLFFSIACTHLLVHPTSLYSYQREYHLTDRICASYGIVPLVLVVRDNPVRMVGNFDWKKQKRKREKNSFEREREGKQRGIRQWGEGRVRGREWVCMMSSVFEMVVWLGSRSWIQENREQLSVVSFVHRPFHFRSIIPRKASCQSKATYH